MYFGGIVSLQNAIKSATCSVTPNPSQHIYNKSHGKCTVPCVLSQLLYTCFQGCYYLPPAEGRGREIIKRLPSVRPSVTFLHKP